MVRVAPEPAALETCVYKDFVGHVVRLRVVVGFGWEST